MKIATSVLDCKDRVKGVLELNRTNISYIHIDVMDGNFVPNIQFDNVGEIRGINLVTKYPMDVHLMVDNPITYIKELSNMNIEFITIHLEIDKDKREIFKNVRDLGYKVGLSIKPNTNVSDIIPYLDEIDLVLIMSVEPGLGGQSFMEGTVDKINKLRELIGARNILIEVDGGINSDTITKIKDVDIAVVGSYITRSDNYYERVEELLKPKDYDKFKTEKDSINKLAKKENNGIRIDDLKGFNFFAVFSIFLIVVPIFCSDNFFAIDVCIVLLLLVFGYGYVLFGGIKKNNGCIKKKKIYLILLIIGFLPFVLLFEFILKFGFSILVFLFGIFFLIAADLIYVSATELKKLW